MESAARIEKYESGGKRNSRNGSIDLLRVFACFLVIVNHTNSVIFQQRDPTHKLWFISITYFFVSKAAVPIFLMISGYLLLNREDTWKKAFGRAAKIGMILVVVGLLSSCFFEKDMAGVIERMSKIHRKAPTTALWYLHLYMSVLLMLPLLQKLTKSMDRKDFYVFFGVATVYSGILPILSHYNENFKITNEFMLPIYGAYVLMLFIGAYFKKFGVIKSRRNIILAVIVLILMTAFNVTATYFEYYKTEGGSYLFFDDRTLFPVVTSAACWFYLAKCVTLPEKVEKAVVNVGSATFGIYLFSDMFIETLNMERMVEYLAQYGGLGIMLGMVACELFVFLAGLTVTWMLKRGM